MASVVVGDLRIACDRAGSGEPLILLHPAFLSKAVWERTLPGLSERFDVMAMDLPGHGGSLPPESWEPDMVAFLVDFLDAVGLKDANWVGSSFSGGLLIRLAAGHPGRVRSLVLSAPTGIPKVEMDRARGKLPKAGSTWQHFSEAFEDSALVTRERYHEFSRLQRVAAPFFRKYRLTHPPDYETVGWVPQMRLVRAPTLLVWGDQDRTIPPPMDERTRREIPGAELVVLKGARHFPYMDRPDEFNRLVIEFVIKSRP